jgi:hypothetical protein
MVVVIHDGSSSHSRVRLYKTRQESHNALLHTATLCSAFSTLCSCAHKTRSKQASETIAVQQILLGIDGWSGFCGAHDATA